MVKQLIATMSAFLAVACLSQSVFAQDVKSYTIDSESSYIHVFTGAEGFLKALSHTHLISIRGISGDVIWDGANSFAEMSMTPEGFFVDADDERAISVDPEYREPVSSLIQSGTRRNMLGSKVLEADLYRDIFVHISLLSQMDTTAEVSVRLTFKRQEFEFQKTVELKRTEDEIQVQADFELAHSDLGLRPFSVPGLTRVADELRFYLNITAVSE